MITRDLNHGQKVKRRSFILAGIKSIFTLIICGKLYYLQILNKSKYGKLSDINRTKVKILYPERGTIFDKFGNPIASNRLDYQLNIFKEKRDNKIVKKSLDKLVNTAKTSENLMPQLITCVENNCTLGEIIIALKTVFGEYLE